MSQAELKLRVAFEAIDRLTKPIKAILQGNRQLIPSFKATHDQLKALQRAQKELAAFRQLREGMRDTATALKTAEQRLQALSERIRASDAPTAAMTRKFSQASSAVTQLSQHYQSQGTQLQALQARLSATGMQTGRLGEGEQRLRTDIKATNAALTTQKAQLAAVAQQEKRLAGIRERMQKTQRLAAHMSVAGYAARATGQHTLTKLHQPIERAQQVQTEQQRIRALGLGDPTSNEAIQFAQQLKTTGTSQAENLTLMRDALSIFADLGHAKRVLPTLAKMKFANQALYGAEEGSANEARFIDMLKVIELRGGASSDARFKEEAERIQKVFTATGGRVGPEQWRGFIQTGGVAAKQLRSDAFYYQMEPLIQEMGGEAVGHGLMSAYSNLYQGKTTAKAAKALARLGLLDPKKIGRNQADGGSGFESGAIKGAALFKASPLEWVEKVLLPTLTKKGITHPDQIKDIIAKVVTDRTASNLLTTMFMQRKQIHKSEKLNTKADGIEALNQRAQQIARGKEIQFLAKFHDLTQSLGEQALPLYTRALALAQSATQRLTTWTKEHPQATKMLVGTAALLGGAMVAAGTFTLALAAILGPLAIVKLSLDKLGIKGGTVSWAFRKIGRLLIWLGRLAFAHPLIALLVALGAVALYVWRNWDTLGPKLARWWGRIKATLAHMRRYLKEKWQSWIEQLTQLKEKWGQVGKEWMQGLADGIRSAFETVKQTLATIIDKLTGWITTPIQVALKGLSSLHEMLNATPNKLATISSVPIDSRVPVTPRQPRGVQVGRDTVQITIQAMPGMDATALARAVRAELDQRERAKLARFASRLTD